jgi:dephospho-CoA kinase
MSKLVIGITGRTGSGKSSACEWLLSQIDNIEHIDCDEIGHNVLEKNTIKEKVIATFGPTICNNTKIDRKALGKIVFNDKDQLNKLNDIVHPEICTIVKDKIKATSKKIVIVEGALIHHVGLEHVCTHTVCIDSPTPKILERQPEKDIILTKQPKSKDYINMCTHTIKNNSSIERFHEKLAQLSQRLSIA